VKLIEVPPHVGGAVFCFEHLTIRAAVAPRLVEQVPMVICQTGEVLPHVRLLGHLACFASCLLALALALPLLVVCSPKPRVSAEVTKKKRRGKLWSDA